MSVCSPERPVSDGGPVVLGRDGGPVVRRCVRATPTGVHSGDAVEDGVDPRWETRASERPLGRTGRRGAMLASLPIGLGGLID